LAGGGSRRMGRDKALLPVAGKSLIEYVLSQFGDRFGEILISVSKPENFGFLPHRLVVDEQPGKGPMMGIQSALRVSAYPKSFVISCDIPEVDLALVESMVAKAGACEIVLPISPGGRFEPLFAVYSRSIRPRMTQLLKKGETSLLPLFPRCRTETITLKNSARFKNLNTPQEYADFVKNLRSP
jgi:molybdopterin-guanine dinucleotide biosynthesis protein A